MRDIKKIVAEMTLQEKASMVSGADFWHLDEIERLGIESTMVCDGPHGLRKQDTSSDNLGINDSVKAVCFPTAVGTASSFDRKLLNDLGKTLGEECRAEDISVLLGPAVNIKRSPLCGRNFEYFSEDPYLAGEMATAYINGVQSKDVGTSIKHFAVNNQEKKRQTISATVDERTLREIYFPAFETAVKKAQPRTVMCSYNRINGVYSSENEWLLTKVLRDEWGFKGYVMSDWGAVSDRVKGLPAGLDLEMPASGRYNTNRLIEAVNNGTVPQEKLDLACERIISIIFSYTDNKDKEKTYVFDREKDHEKAHKAAVKTMVLLKNDGILPLDKKKKIVFIGEYADKPRFQGGGSSHINTKNVVSALKAAKGKYDIDYAKGFSGVRDEYDPALARDAVIKAKDADIAVIFAGLPEVMESEGFDRKHLNMPNCQNRLIREITAVQPNTIVLLHNGSPVVMPWLDDVKGVLECYLAGEAVGEAQIDILFGKVNPSAKLAETFPKTLADTPSFGNFPGGSQAVEYREGIYVGYRYYDKTNTDVVFPFGFGLSYTTFEYSDIKLSKKQLKSGEKVKVSFKIKNTGKVAGEEIAQIYISAPENKAFRAPKELKEFVKVSLKPGEEKEVSVELDTRSFAFYNTDISDWDCENGKHEILVGASSRDIRLKGAVTLKGYSENIRYPKSEYPTYYSGDMRYASDEEFSKLIGAELTPKYRKDCFKIGKYMSLDDAKHFGWGKKIYDLLYFVLSHQQIDFLGSPEMLITSSTEMPFINMVTMSDEYFTKEMLDGLCELLNKGITPSAAKNFINGGVADARRLMFKFK